ncbi:MAG: NERD domain-containing protein [Candidatus Pacebacteria bacterium]|nr:NERD domain-containing protein [Candidatus Paceibacterota bacterium]
MAKSYNQIGALRELLDILDQEGINDFTTLEEIRSFRFNFKKLLEDIKSKNKELLSQNISDLESEYKELSEELNEKIKIREVLLKKEREEIVPKIAELENKRNKLMIPIYWIKRKYWIRKKYILETKFDEQVKKPFKSKIHKSELLKNEIDDKKSNTDKWIDIFSKEEVDRANFVLSAIDDNKNMFYGAEGEERALNELLKLPDTYSVINDYRKKFKRPLHDKRSDDWIYSVQIDHVVVGPTGVYIIETKNWSQNSVESRDLFSPVKQLKRTSYAMFILLNNLINNRGLISFGRNWGDQQVSPKNFILLMGHKPVETYQFVKIVTIPEINSHLTYGDKIFSEKEVEELVEYLTDN